MSTPTNTPTPKPRRAPGGGIAAFSAVLVILGVLAAILGMIGMAAGPESMTRAIAGLAWLLAGGFTLIVGVILWAVSYLAASEHYLARIATETEIANTLAAEGAAE